MTTLLIDNYDSYTYNLFQLLSEVNGCIPTVIRNDDPRWSRILLKDFNNVVLSPGPGNPSNNRDFGVCKEVLTQHEVPVLGVCLGHQGIGHFAGAQVVSAPTPRHGYVSTIQHDDDELFSKIPQQFQAVRYHSLCVGEPLPETLKVIARAEDGVVMGIKHCELPQWGIQFHPESVATEYGFQLLKNFKQITKQIRKQSPIVVSTVKTKKQEVESIDVLVERIDVEVDAQHLFQFLYGESKFAFWLDSSRVEQGSSRFSFLGDSREVIQFGLRENRNIFEELSQKLLYKPNVKEVPFDFVGGYVGFFGYEVKELCESVNIHKSDNPDAVWMLADRFVVIDHEKRHTYVVATATHKDWLEETKKLISEFVVVDTQNDHQKINRDSQDKRFQIAINDVEQYLLRNKDEYLQDINTCLKFLHDGESYELCLTNKVVISTEGKKYDPFDLYVALRSSNPAPYAAFLKMDKLCVLSSSPERFLKINKSRFVETKPIKGTSKRDVDLVIDKQLKTTLANSAKTNSENLMIVDLMRNDLGKVCEVGTVYVSKLMDVETYETVHHLVSTINGKLSDDKSSIDCVMACFPGGSMTGAPKLRTIEITDSLELQARGIYSGVLGFLGYEDVSDLSIAIRTVVCSDTEITIGAGGAIVLDSDPIDEYEEMLLKVSAVANILGESS